MSNTLSSSCSFQLKHYLKKNTKLCARHLKPSATLGNYPSVHFQGSKKIPCLLKYINVFNEIRNAYKCVVTARIIAACQPKAFSDISHTYNYISHCTSFTPHTVYAFCRLLKIHTGWQFGMFIHLNLCKQINLWRFEGIFCTVHTKSQTRFVLFALEQSYAGGFDCLR